MNNYSIFFTFEDQVLQLPHNPETMPVELGGENQAYNVLGIGPITVPRTPKQKRIQIESYFPHDYDILPETYIKFFQDAMYEQRILVYTPVRAYEDGTAYTGGDDGFQCLVENFTTEERGGETGDFYYSLEIVEYRDYSPTIIEVRPIQTGYALSTTPTRTSDGMQVGDTVSASGPAYVYSTDTEVGNVSNATGTVVRKGTSHYTLKSEQLLAELLAENEQPGGESNVKITKSSSGHEFIGGGRTFDVKKEDVKPYSYTGITGNERSKDYEDYKLDPDESTVWHIFKRMKENVGG